mmetsp:Transcript_59052/g.175583  ORF Transcript_59052/g.175583 Transcript_59052/m.175583 type:complete len:380 (+) Transcript_59052:517-1656(+)
MVLVKRPQSPQRRVDVVVAPPRARRVPLLGALDDALHQYRIVAVEMQRELRRAAQLHKVRRIVQGTGEAVQQYPPAGIFPHSTSDEGRDDGARHQLSPCHDRRAFPPQGSIPLHLVPEHIAAAHVHDRAFLLESIAQQTLPAPGSAYDEDDPGGSPAQNVVGRREEFLKMEPSVSGDVVIAKQTLNDVVFGSFPDRFEKISDSSGAQVRSSLVDSSRFGRGTLTGVAVTGEIVKEIADGGVLAVGEGDRSGEVHQFRVSDPQGVAPRAISGALLGGAANFVGRRRGGDGHGTAAGGDGRAADADAARAEVVVTAVGSGADRPRRRGEGRRHYRRHYLRSSRADAASDFAEEKAWNHRRPHAWQLYTSRRSKQLIAGTVK